MTRSLWAAFLVNWLFWSGTAIGAVVFAALLDLVNARWAAQVRTIALRCHRFLAISLLASVALLLHAPRVHGRTIAALLVVYAAAFWFSRGARGAGQARTPTTVIFLVAYVAGFSLLANDAIMALDPTWVSTLFPAYTFVANVYGGIAMVGAIALAADLTGYAPLHERQRRDLGIVLVGFALLWMYLVWSQYLVIWYGNLPEETGYIVRRSTGNWRAVTSILLITRFALPVVALITRIGRRPIPFLLIAVAGVVGFWMEYLLMLAPTSAQLAAFSATAITLTFAVAFFVPLAFGNGADLRSPQTYSESSSLR